MSAYLQTAIGHGMRAVMHVADLSLLSWRSSRLLRAELAFLAAAVVASPYRDPGFESRLLASRRWGSPDDCVYGETPWWTLRALLRLAALEPGQHFYDLGCGSGRTLALAAACFSARATGVEWVKARVDVARTCLPSRLWPEVQLVHGDAAEADLAVADVVLTTWTCFTARSRRAVEAALLRTRPGTRILTITHPIQCPGFELRRALRRTFSWGSGEVYLYCRQGSAASDEDHVSTAM